MKKKIFCLLWLKILLLIILIKPIRTNEVEILNETGYYITIKEIDLNLYFDEHSTLDNGLELHNLSLSDGPLIIMGHSGKGKLALFNDLEFLEKGIKIIITHNNYQKIYEIIDLLYYEKFSNVHIPNDNNYLYLITCDKYDMKKQLIINAKIAKTIYY